VNREAGESESSRLAGEPGEDQGRVGPMLGRVRERVNSELNVRKDRASHMLDDLAGAVRRMSEPLHDPSLAALGDYAEQAAERLENFASEVRERDVAELADEVRGLARQRPAVFAAATFATGLVAARFLKSTSEVRATAGAASRRRPRRPVPGEGRSTRREAGPNDRTRQQQPEAASSVQEQVHGKEERRS
jgi:hypothetical protein